VAASAGDLPIPSAKLTVLQRARVRSPRSQFEPSGLSLGGFLFQRADFRDAHPIRVDREWASRLNRQAASYAVAAAMRSGSSAGNCSQRLISHNR
jgi:hypothetical protein